MRINTNMAALNAWRNMSVNSGNVQKSLEKLSSGFRINRAADDAAGLAVSEKMRAQIRGTQMATRNAQDGISLVQTAEGALTETHSILQRMRELGVQASTSTLNTEDALQVSTEFEQLKKEVDRIATNTKFNTKVLLDGTANVTAASTSTDISVVSATGDTKAGTVSATQKATAATSTLTVNTTTGTDVTISGQTISWAAGASNTVIIAAINAKSALTGVTAGEQSTVVAGSILLTNGAKGAAAVPPTIANGTGTSAVAWGGAKNSSVTVAGTGGGTFYGGATDTVAITSGDLTGLTLNVVNTAATANAAVTVTDNAFKIQVGAEAGQQLAFTTADMSTTGLGLASTSVTTQTGATASITALDTAINRVSTQRSNLGAIQNRLEHTVASLQVTAENLQGAESRIRDVDMASEMASFTKNNILMQASQSMLAQANQSTQGILALLR